MIKNKHSAGSEGQKTNNNPLEVIEDSPVIQQYSLDQLLDRVVLGDAVEVLRKIPDACADLVFFDPPYNLQLPNKRLTRWSAGTVVNGVNDHWDKFSSFEEYDKFLRDILVEIRRLLKSSGTIWGIATYHNLFRMGKIMQDLGYWILNDLIWVKPNPMPNWLQVRFTNATETLIWALPNRESRGYSFNKEWAKEFGIGKIGANVWMLPTCTGRERLKDENRQKIHSTQKPVELLRRIILTSSKAGDLILDPLSGVGTTGFVAQALGRHFVMIERNPVYVQAVQQRFTNPIRLCSELTPGNLDIDKPG